MKTKKKEKLKFIFPNMMARMMKNVDMRSQMEASMMSMFMIMVGMCLMTIYLIIYGEMGFVYKGLILFNLCCAFLFISSFLVTTYQQYISYMETAGIDPSKHREEILKRGNIFKRIKIAMHNRKKRKEKEKELEQPLIVKDAIENMIEIKQEELKDMKKLEKKAEQMAKEERTNKMEIKK